MKKILCVAVILWAAVAASGQEGGEYVRRSAPPVARGSEFSADAARLLKSNVMSERAWGAHLVWRNELREHVPALVALLDDPALGFGPEEQLVRRAALDSLIQLGEKVPAEKLLPLYQNFHDETIILLSQSPEENTTALLSIFDERMTNARWLAVGNSLAQTRARGFALPLLRELKIEADVFVFDAERDFYTGGGGGSGGCGYGPVPAPAEFPPVGFYALTDEQMRGAVVTAPGRHTVYHVRMTSPNPCIGYDHTYFAGVRDVYRHEYLADLLGTAPDALDLQVNYDRTVICKDARACRRALIALRAEINNAFRNFTVRLVEEGHVEAGEASELRPDITFRLHDYRKNRTELLPQTLRGVKFAVE